MRHFYWFAINVHFHRADASEETFWVQIVSRDLQKWNLKCSTISHKYSENSIRWNFHRDSYNFSNKLAGCNSVAMTYSFPGFLVVLMRLDTISIPYNLEWHWQMITRGTFQVIFTSSLLKMLFGTQSIGTWSLSFMWTFNSKPCQPFQLCNALKLNLILTSSNVTGMFSSRIYWKVNKMLTLAFCGPFSSSI